MKPLNMLTSSSHPLHLGQPTSPYLALITTIGIVISTTNSTLAPQSHGGPMMMSSASLTTMTTMIMTMSPYKSTFATFSQAWSTFQLLSLLLPIITLTS